MSDEFLGSEEELELRGVWLSRLMFGGLVRPEFGGRYVETRTYEEFLAAVRAGCGADDGDGT